MPVRVRLISAGVCGAGAALLLGRLLLRLLAARPDNPALAAFLAISAPPPLVARLDYGQPQFGATLEFSTLALFVLLSIIVLIIAASARRTGK